MVKSKFYNLDTDTALGGANASDLYVASEKAVKTYVDNSIPTITSSVTSESTDALTSGGAYVNLVTAVVADDSNANKIKVTKAGTTTTITVDNVANAVNAIKATQDAFGNVITTTYAIKSELPTTTIRIWS